MNEKQNALYKIVDIVVQCCATELEGGVLSLTAKDLLGKSKCENVCMGRAILVNQLLWAGFSITTLSSLLNRSPHAIRQIQRKHNDYVSTSRAYRIALSEVTIKCKDIEPHGF